LAATVENMFHSVLARAIGAGGSDKKRNLDIGFHVSE
jgi:hypothetical protein